MFLLKSLIVTLLLHALVDANQVKFVKIQHKIYVETDANHYALYGQITDQDGVQIIVVNNGDHYHINSKCDYKWQALKKIDQRIVESYGKIRENYLKVEAKSGAEKGIYSDTYSWSETLSPNPIEYSATVLEKQTVAITSKYLPPKLAKVIASGPVLIFIHANGNVRMKTVNCLQKNERILLDGLRKVRYNNDKKQKSLFSSSPDEILRKHIKKHPIDECTFYNEQNYMTTYSKEQYRNMQFYAGGAILDGGRGGDYL